MEIFIENQPVKIEFIRWYNYFGKQDPYTERGNIGILDVLRAHFLVVDYFYGQSHGVGGIGPKDPNLLHSAVYRQFTGFDGKDKWETSYERCATLLFGLIKDHPFHDANKRTALLVMLYYLNRINRVPTVRQKVLEDFIVQISENELKQFRRLKALELNTDDPEIYFIADYLRRNSRQIDNRFYTITYRELDSRLREFGYCLNNPHNNFIDVSKIEKSRGFLGLGKERVELSWRAQIGFPGWKRQVGRGAISTVRKKTGLTPERGVDSEAFFRGTDPLYSLISEYSAPLERLAYR
ncbi:MAG: type II toxin-antitoxin system death-on-curing family toxin [Blastocatellales bacterium]